MTALRFPALAGLLLVALVGISRPQPVAADTPAPAGFAAFVDDYYAALFAWEPNQATYAGIHDFDEKLADLNAPNITHRADVLKKLHERLKTLRAGKLTADEAIDAETLDHAIRAELLELEVVRDWKRNPVVYLGKPAEGIDMLMKRSFAPPADRLKAVIGRLKAAPQLLGAMKTNVENPPKEFTDLGLIVAKGSVSFFRNDLPAWAKDAAGKDKKLFAEFEAANKPVIEAFEAAAKWIETELLPKSKGKYAIGPDAFVKKLETEEMLDVPLDKLLAIGEANLKRDQETFVATAKKIDPKRTPAEVLATLNEDHPKPEDLVGATRGTIERTRKFLVDKKIVTVPSEVRPTIAETPAFMRTGGFASMDTPGAYETKATEAFYYVTPPETEWEARRKVEHMRQFNKTGMDIITIHEAFPGHYLQFLYAKQYPTKVRKLYTCGTNVEGWAHYAEQMIVEEGYGDGDPKVRLAQLNEALLRDCRYIVGIKLHTEGWTVEQGKKFFVEQGYIEPETAFQEARRGSYNPTYLYYTLGKLQIYKLRDDYKKAKGADFRLQTFHDEFVRQGGLPIKLIRKIMLPGDTGPTL
ncbi:Uncharacterized protein OS=Myxococcus stipitatus (strain DSM 14675 / JCM 12634 / Mx s8) GN=MYSTI_05584 PE=4 SV=1: DUF885 [Gemmata massiliana]|uniref:DUF885 domain-containing protein n=1 Tax=Gemmata massiliana TaxID=1210884 RepID=A0A6P2CQZ5_9BACT|nr:DUF885 domain-containing protein [Gemmata massiliana]VTR90987.1 Uncharacterized protein OS=Myxococcus stipitatus (strain DSM 14675 / JCM 12634 / Mx s8) GN=MYSTI_05584 PE=4 SV=1: DUF885 [Gemmata massiliana]